MVNGGFFNCATLALDSHNMKIYVAEEDVHMHRKNYFWKTLVGVSLSLTVAFSGSALFAPAAHAAVSSPVNANLADRIISTGEKYLGVRYELGAQAGRTDVFDCSSFTQHVFKQHGIKLPRSSRQQVQVGTYVPKSQLKKGDLVFYSTSATGPGKVGHVAIYAGNGKLLHTYAKPYGVTYMNMDSKWWEDNYITARRVLPSEGNISQPDKQLNSPAGGQAIRLTANATKEVKSISKELIKNGYNAYSNPEQWLDEGRTVPTNQLRKGDLLFFSTVGSKSYIEHVGVYVDSGKILHLDGKKKEYYSVKDDIVQKSFVVAKRMK
jgi:cell wall-associated NlpC family hydrolase